MKDEIKEAVKTLAKKAGQSDSAIDAQQNAQAALNLTNAFIALENNAKS